MSFPKIFTFFIIFIITIVSKNVQAKTITIANKGNQSVFIYFNNEKNVLKSGTSIVLNDKNNVFIKLNDSTETLILDFLDQKENLIVEINNQNELTFFGDKKNLYSYIYNQLGKDSYSKIDDYQKYSNARNLSGLKLTSEILLIDILKKVGLKNILAEEGDSEQTKTLKQTVKYSWLSAIFLSVYKGAKNSFYQEYVKYYFTNYVKDDISSFDCFEPQSYRKITVFENVVKAGLEKELALPTYEIVQNSEFDDLLKYLPYSCQKYYFRRKLNIYNPRYDKNSKDYYKDILINKFNFSKERLN